MAVTQEDVALLAGVARRTVSNVVNDFPHVSPEVRERVQNAIKVLGYQPNRAAQNLRTGRSDTIGVILPELDVGYFAEMGRLLVEEAERRGYTVLIAQTLGLPEREIEVLDKFARERPDGLIFSPISIGAADLDEHARSLPVVLLGEHLAGTDRSHVVIDNVAATRDIVEHLVSRGRRRIAFIGQIQRGELSMSDLRLRGYRAALEAHGLPFDPALVRRVDGYHRAQGYTAATELLASGAPFDAVFCATDLLAIGALRALADRAVAVPSAVAVAGFDDLDEGRYCIPRLTTVSPDKALIARRAVDLLLSRIEGGTAEPVHFGADSYRVIVRESS